MNSLEMRKKFFDFFIKHGSTKVPSSPLIPAQDPTLLFTNAGMNQFKDLFLGKEKRSYTRAVSIQKCMRAGGKHSDLDNVGFTSRHLTFFEMMGNFSFGDYFKKEAIRFAWDFLTQEMQFNPETMYATVFHEDDESYTIWHKEIGLPQEKISRLGAADNFWQMGDTGPCGPCTEIYIDRGMEFGCGKKTCAPSCSCDRFLEVWNLVFMQFNRQEDGTDQLLTQTGVDTGMGLERLCVIMQKKNSVFETDLFEPIMRRIEELTGLSYAKADPKIKAAFNVIADHVRASTFLIADGVTPSNEGRGYVLRKIIRRAALFSQKLTDKIIFPEVAQAVIDCMNPIYPELKPAATAIKHLLKTEIEKFSSSLVHGQTILETFFQENSNNKIITGKQAFKLYDTFGFPLELTRVIAHEKGFTVDVQAFDQEMALQKERSGGKITKEETITITLPDNLVTEFVGYQVIENKSPIIGLIHNNALVRSVSAGQECWVITQQSPFFVEKGGQISDEGTVQISDKETRTENLKRINNTIAINITAPTTINVGDTVISKVDHQRRLDTMNNHTATHLLQSALIEILGKEVKQSGSLVHPDYLRFDFTYHKTMIPDEIKRVEDRVNQKIRENLPVTIYETTYQKAIEKGVIAIFGEKYNPENVRVIDIAPFSMELCGGTHVRTTGDIGAFKITQETALSAGQRRIFALTGRGAMELFQQDFDIVKNLSQDFKIQHHELINAIEKQKQQLKDAESHIKKLKKALFKNELPRLLASVETINNIPFGFFVFKDGESEELKDIAQDLLHKKAGFYFLISCQEDRCSFLSIVDASLESTIDLKKLSELLAKQGLRGGGKKGMLQGGGNQIDVIELEKTIIKFLGK